VDDRRFDELAKTLGRSMSRRRFLGLVAQGIALGWGSLIAPSALAAKNHRRKRRNLRKRNCQSRNEDAICHCAPGQDGFECRIQCDPGGGHDAHPFDCRCFDSDPANPRPLPFCARCPPDPENGELCSPIPPPDPVCRGDCFQNENCAALENCVCVRTRRQRRTNNPGSCRTVTPTCPTDCPCGCPGGSITCIPADQCPPPTCGGNCDDAGDCPALENCICLRTRKQRRNNKSGTCRTVAPEPPPATCEGLCDNNRPCPSLADCVCIRTRRQRRNDNPGICRTVALQPPACPADCLCGCPEGSATCIPVGQCLQGPCPAGCPCGCPAGFAICIPQSRCPAPPTPSHNKRRKKGGSSSRASGRGCDSDRQCASHKCQRGKCCDPKGNHCRSDSECCSGRCEWVHSPDRPDNPDEDRQCA
jgi:hypothetical protein